MYSKMQGRIGCARQRQEAPHPVGVDDDDLAVLDVADELRADDVERAGLRAEDRAAVELAEHERADAERIARADQLLVGQRDESVGALDLGQAPRRSGRRFGGGASAPRASSTTSVSVVDWQIAPPRMSSRLQRQAVGQIAVVGDREPARPRVRRTAAGRCAAPSRRSSNSAHGRSPIAPGSRSMVAALEK